MKTKVKETKKDVNIDIKIENNLMSKNKNTTQDEGLDVPSKANQFKKPLSSAAYQYNPDLPRLVNEYYGVMASKQLYDFTSSRQTPLNLNQYFPTGAAASTSDTNRLQSQLAPMTPIHQQNTSGYPYHSGNEDEDEDSNDNFEDTMSHPENEEDGNEENQAELNPLNIPHIDFLNGRMRLKKFKSTDVTVNMIKASALTKEQEDYMASAIHQSEMQNRALTITRAKTGHRVQPRTIVKYNIGSYIRDHNPMYWAELTGLNPPLGS